MRKVELKMNEELKYQTIKKLVETNGNKKRASIKLQCTVRSIDRMIAGYKEKGKEFFIHGNRGRKPAHALSEQQKSEIGQLYLSKYFDCNYTVFTAYIALYCDFNISCLIFSKISLYLVILMLFSIIFLLSNLADTVCQI